MWRKLLLHCHSPTRRTLSSSSTAPDGSAAAEIPTLYSFLQPSIFALRPQTQAPTPAPTTTTTTTATKPSPPSTTALESQLQSSLHSLSTDDAWKSFKSLAAASRPPQPHLADALVAHLSSLPSLHNLKRAFAASIFLIDRHRLSLSPPTLASLFRSFAAAATPAPALALARSLLKNRSFAPFPSWGPPLIEMTRAHNAFSAFLPIFDENCRLCLTENVDSMKPDLDSCNLVLEGCCWDLGSVADAERVVKMMSSLNLSPDERSFGSLAYLYAAKGLKSRVEELDKLMDALGFGKMVFFKNLISGHVKSGNFELVSLVILRALQDRGNENCSILGEESYAEMVKGYLENGRIKDLVTLIIEAQELELNQETVEADHSVGFGVMNACVGLGLLDKAHSILDEMNARGALIGLGVYSSILKAYCKEQRTAEATQLVTEIAASGLRLDACSYDALIDASMSTQDFQSAFSLFREMREARLPDLKTSYLTVMTGLMENNRPELMAAFIDSVVDDPRIEIATHDWNSIIHAFCKVGRLEDARRTYRRMVFLRFEPNNQTYLSLINGYVSAEKYFSVLLLWTELRRKGVKFDHGLVDAFLYALVKGGFFDAAMQVIEKAQELKIFLDKWRHKQAFMENHKKLKVAKLRRRNFRKMEALVAFKNWAGLSA